MLQMLAAASVIVKMVSTLKQLVSPLWQSQINGSELKWACSVPAAPMCVRVVMQTSIISKSQNR